MYEPVDEEVVIDLVKHQILGIIKQAIKLQKRKELIDKLIFYESIVYLITSSVSNIVGASDIEESSRIIVMYGFLALGILFSCFALFIKWLKTRHSKDINSYRDILKELVGRYGEDAWVAIERGRMELPPEVIAAGFFRGISNT